MFDCRYQVIGQDVPTKLRFKDVIFVMEDVDAVSKIVHRRDGKDVSGTSTTTVEVSTTNGDTTATLKKTLSTLATVDEKPGNPEGIQGVDAEAKSTESPQGRGKNELKPEPLIGQTRPAEPLSVPLSNGAATDDDAQ